MRMLSVAAVLAAAVILPVRPVSAQTLDEIIEMNLKAKGGIEKIRATETVRMTGTISARDPVGQEMKANMIIWWMAKVAMIISP